MRASLRSEVFAHLEAVAPSSASAPEIGLAVRARRGHVDECLRELVSSGAVERGERPGRATYFRIASSASEFVPQRRAGSYVTDGGFLLAVLADGGWHTLTEILARSFRDRGCGLTVHSRAAELRRHGHVIENRIGRTPIAGPGRRGFERHVSSYRLVARAASPQVVAGAHGESAEAA